ncbi:MAG: glycosyltransferase family 2 protein [Ruminococcaceae bacterium]|nr:glycosyltransferase family 2 protein [Oscillospiraceae bacterium]
MQGKVSFVIPCYRSEKTLSAVIDEIIETVGNKIKYEIVLVNDSSPDNTLGVIKQLCEKNSNIIGVNFAQNFGQHAALMAGMRQTTGDVVVCLDDDGQTPANEVFKLIDKLEEGYDVVYAKYGNKKHSSFRNLGSKVNSAMTESLLSKPKKLYISSYFAAKRFVVDKMLEYDNPFPYVIGLVLRTTKNIANVEVNHRQREVGESGYTLKKLISLWVNGFTAFSVKPLRLATIGGVMVAIIGFICFVCTIINKIINPDVPLGWSSTMAVMLILGGLILLVLGMIGEYIGRIYICINHSPQYVIREIIKNERIENKEEL